MDMLWCLTDKIEKERGIISVEPEQFNVAMLRAATNNFSEEKKLGQGGFGEVFKVQFYLRYHSTLGCYITTLHNAEIEKFDNI